MTSSISTIKNALGCKQSKTMNTIHVSSLSRGIALVILRMLHSNFSSSVLHSLRGISLVPLPWVINVNILEDNHFKNGKKCCHLFFPWPAEVIAINIEKSLNLRTGRNIIQSFLIVVFLLLGDIEGGEVPLLVLAHQEGKLAERFSIVPAIIVRMFETKISNLHWAGWLLC